jgi:hypothetical protein
MFPRQQTKVYGLTFALFSNVFVFCRTLRNEFIELWLIFMREVMHCFSIIRLCKIFSL